MAIEVKENDEVNLETPFKEGYVEAPLKEGSVHSTESVQNPDHMNS